MGLYRINNANSVFPGRRGDRFHAEDGPYMRAAIRAGAVSRLDSDVEADKHAVEQEQRRESPVEATESVPEGEVVPETVSPKAKKGK